MLRVGLFWYCGFSTNLEAEGIGRHSIRLTEGLLSIEEKLEIAVVTDGINLNTVSVAFSQIKHKYNTRLNVIPAEDISWINANVHVDIWIVPYVGLWKAVGLSKPFILCLHDLGYIHFPDRERDYHSLRIDAIAPDMANKAVIVVCNSDFVRDNECIKYLNLPSTKVRVIRLAPPAEEYKSFSIIEEAAFRQKYGFVHPYLVYPSALRYYKNHYRLIEAFISFRNSSEGHATKLLLVMTDIPQPNLHPEHNELWNLHPKCADVEVSQSIVFRNRFPIQEMPSLYHYAVGTIVPTLFEGSCPFPILESLILGTPVAFSDIPVTWEVVPRKEGMIVFNPYSVGEIEQAIYLLWRNRGSHISQQREVMTTALLRTWSDVAKEYVCVMDKIKG